MAVLSFCKQAKTMSAPLFLLSSRLSLRLPSSSFNQKTLFSDLISHRSVAYMPPATLLHRPETLISAPRLLQNFKIIRNFCCTKRGRNLTPPVGGEGKVTQEKKEVVPDYSRRIRCRNFTKEEYDRRIRERGQKANPWRNHGKLLRLRSGRRG